MSLNNNGRALVSALVVVALLAAVALVAYLTYKRSGQSEEQCAARRRPDGGAQGRSADDGVVPGGRPEDAAMAQTNPDEYAWKLFLAINRQALQGKRGEADPGRPTVGDYDDDKPVVWETWALSSGGREGRRVPDVNRSEVFLNRGEKPKPWDELGTSDKSLDGLPAKQMEGLFEFADSLRLAKASQSRGFSAQALDNTLEREALEPRFIDPTIAEQEDGSGQEVRMNRAAFEHVVAHTLYNIEGLEEAYRRFVSSANPANPEKINVPAAAQEIKAVWVRIREEDKPRYHWRSLPAKGGGKPQIWGLTALHITTKDLENWFWSDFEHVDYLHLPVHSVARELSGEIDRGELPSRDTSTRGAQAQHAALDCQGKAIEGLREETVGTKWQYYRLRGTQIHFTCVNELTCATSPTLLANTQIEKGFQQSSSCITCHARASIGLRESEDNFFPNTLKTFLDIKSVAPQGFLLIGAVGEPKEDWFFDGANRKFIRTDFMWSLPFRAMSTKAAAPTPASGASPVCTSPCPTPPATKPSP